MQGCGFFKTWCHVCVYLGLDLEKRVRFCGGLFLEVTVFFRIKKSGHRAYVQVVENKRFDGAVRQSVIANLGRADDLIASGALASLLASGAKFTDQVLLITTLDEDSDGSLSVAAKRIGGPLLFGRIWERLGIADVLGELLKQRAFEFAVERAVFVGTLHRLFVSGSDRDCASWMADYDITGVEGLDLHHFYRAMAWLGEELEEKPAEALAPRCVKDVIEEKLFERRRDLFTDLSAVFMDTTSLSFYGEGGETLGEHGYSKDYRPDLKQMILGLVVDGSGSPICTEMWPGNTADVTTLLPVIDRLRQRFGIDRVCIVADRGMISAAAIAGLEERQLESGNSAYRRYLRKTGEHKNTPIFEIDLGKLAEEARFDGIFVLRTNAKITPLQAILRYRDLLKVENLFLRTKAVMRTRPIFHSSDAAIRGHVFCSFLALVMQKYLEDLSCQAGVVPEWKSLLRDLDRLQQVRIRHRGNDWVVRTDVAKPIADLFRHAHIAMPPRAKQMAPPKLVSPTKSARKRRGRPRRGATSLPISPKAA